MGGCLLSLETMKCSMCGTNMSKNKKYCSRFCHNAKRELNGLIALKEIEEFVRGGEEDGLENSARGYDPNLATER